jgi:hypothetical protein
MPAIINIRSILVRRILLVVLALPIVFFSIIWGIWKDVLLPVAKEGPDAFISAWRGKDTL